ncbi:MAG: anti-sigma factor [Actinomycetia bacterium]|nr:anti-sigma factor [Actinomycetes bacterium]
MNCQDARASLLAGETTDKVESHLDGCVECRRAVGDIEHVRMDLRSESMWVEPPSGLEDSIVAAVTGVGSSETSLAPDVTHIESRRFSSRSVAVMFGSVAAALFLIVGVFAMLSRSPSPDWEATMAGTDVSPSASAVVTGWNMDAGTRVVFESSDLGPAPDGFVYQLWFSKGSQDISAGTFTDPSHVELTVGIARKDYPTVWLALQPTNVNAGDAGPALLVSSDA